VAIQVLDSKAISGCLRLGAWVRDGGSDCSTICRWDDKSLYSH
jgi:hypothetical protein